MAEGNLNANGQRDVVPSPDPALDDHALRWGDTDRPATKEAGLGKDYDEEEGTTPTSQEEVADPQRHTIERLYGRYRIFVHMFIWLFFTG